MVKIMSKRFDLIDTFVHLTCSLKSQVRICMQFVRHLKFNFPAYFKMQGQKTIGTHSGAFHMDEVLGCAMLTRYTNEFQNASITRSRDDNVLKNLDLVLDVGRVYDPSNKRFDHHQKEFQDTFGTDYQIRLSSAGLVYKHFGREVVKNIAAELLTKYPVNIELNEENVELIYKRLYDNFILYVDAVDNGVNQYSNDVRPKYKVNSHLSTRIGRLNPSHYEENVSFDQRFHDAMKVAEEELVWQVRDIVMY